MPLDRRSLAHFAYNPRVSGVLPWSCSGDSLLIDTDVVIVGNVAERCHRGPVVARKNFYGSGALWSGRLAAMSFSLFQTMQVWGMDVGHWLTAYLTACAQAGGKPPPDPGRYCHGT